MNQRNTQHRNIIFLKEQKGPIDKYESPTSLSKFVPLIKHKHIPDETLKLLRNPTYLKTLRYIIITSQRTAECLSEDILPRLTREQLQGLLTKCVYTVGPATGMALRKLGFKDIRGEDTGNGAALSKFIVEDLLAAEGGEISKRSNSIGEILFLVGVIRKDIVTRTLTEAGLKVREVVTYETSDLDDNLPRFQSALCGIRQFVNGNEDNNSNDNNNFDNSNNGCWVVVFSPQGVSPELIDYIKDEQQQQQQQESNSSISSIGECSFEMENVDGVQSIRSSISSQSSIHSIPLKVACIGPTTEMFLTRCGLKPEVVSPKPNPTALHNALEEYDSNFS